MHTRLQSLQNEVQAYLQRFLPSYVYGLSKSEDVFAFHQIQNDLRSATRSTFRDVVASLDDVVVIQVADPFGAKFGLGIAQKNPSAQVALYDPANIGAYAGFPPFLFNELNKEEIAKLSYRSAFSPSDAPGALNNLFRENGLKNISYHQEKMTPSLLKTCIADAKGKPVVLFADRINDLAPMLAKVAGTNNNVHAVLMPLLNGPLNGSYERTATKELINEHIDQIFNEDTKYQALHQTPEGFLPFDFNESSRLHTMINLYQSLDLAKQANASVFVEEHAKSGAPYHQPNFYVSTIQPC